MNESHFGAEVERKIEVAGVTRGHEKHPKNEDVILINEQLGLFGVFDGLGGGNAGDIAATTAAESVKTYFEEVSDDLDFSETKEALKEAVLQASREVAHQGKMKEELLGMQTTGAIVKLWERDGSRKFAIANVGDSRVYRISSEASLEQITKDDSILRLSKLDEGSRRIVEGILASAQKREDLERNDLVGKTARHVWEMRNVVLQSIGSNSIYPDIFSIEDIRPGETILITSDGIHDNLTAEEIEAIVREGLTAEQTAEKLVVAARAVMDAGKEKMLRSKNDDASAVVIRL